VSHVSVSCIIVSEYTHNGPQVISSSLPCHGTGPMVRVQEKTRGVLKGVGTPQTRSLIHVYRLLSYLEAKVTLNDAQLLVPIVTDARLLIQVTFYT